MSSTSVLNSVLSALGGSTGIDVTSAVNTILYADRAPERVWQAQQTNLVNQTAAINQLESEASSLSDALSALQSSTGVLGAVTANTSNSGLLTASAADGTVTGNHIITISSLASAGSWYSDTEASSSSQLPSGGFSITVGGTQTSIATGGSSGVDTLDELASSINTQSLGVIANVITDVNGARLALTSTTTGSAGDFSVSGGGSLGFTRSGTGFNASITVDGVPISSATNTVTGAIGGVTLNLLGASPKTDTSPATSINLSLAPDSSSIATAVSTFVNTYNALIKDVSTQIGYNKTTGTAGVLQTDSTAQGLQSALLASTNYAASSGTYKSLDSLGISTNSDGTLSLNTALLANAVQQNSAGVATFFQGAARDGFAASVTSSLSSYTDSTQGAFTVDLKSISNEYQDLADQTSTLEIYLSARQKVLTAQYNAADIALQQLPQKLKQIQALLNPNQNSSSS